MPPRTASTGQLLEVACDESGSEGENLVDGNTDVYAHAGVRVAAAPAGRALQEIHARIRSPVTEYKANHLLRGKHRAALEWLLGPAGPLYGNAHVHLTDKTFFAVGRVVDLLTGAGADPAAGPCRGGDARAMAVVLLRDGERVFGHGRWQCFRVACNDLMRTRNRPEVTAPVDAFFRTVDALRDPLRDPLHDTPRDTGRPARTAEGPAAVDRVLARLARGRPYAEAFRARFAGGPDTVPVLDPMLPALARTVAYWSAAGGPVPLVHDRQNQLTEERVALLGAGASLSLRFVQASTDARVQLADFLAGVARKIASDELNGRGDARLTALLRPYAAASSFWGDERSRAALLCPAPGAAQR